MKKLFKAVALAVVAVIIAISVVACDGGIIKDIIGLFDGSEQTTDIDAAKMTNEITTDKIHALFTVVAEYKKGSGRFPFSGSSSLRSQGSAVAFYKQDGYVFILTNCHVVADREGYSQATYTVTDYAGNSYSARLLQNDETGVNAISPDYDLACLYFRPSGDYTVLDIADEDPSVGETVVALGAPENQSNAITFGKVNSYVKTEVQADASLSNVTFSVICHDAYIDNGSSGGPLINKDYEIVGINYGGSEDNSISLAVPATKVNEFLKAYVWAEK